MGFDNIFQGGPPPGVPNGPALGLDITTGTLYVSLPQSGQWAKASGVLSSVFGRTGAVVAQSGDYTASQVGAVALGAAVLLAPTSSQTVVLGINPLVFSMSLSGSTLTIGDDTNTDILVIHSSHSEGITIFSHNSHIPTLALSSSGGTQASPTATALNNELGLLAFFGYTGSVYAQSASIDVRATELWTGSAQGSQIRFFHTITGGTTLIQDLVLNDAGAGANFSVTSSFCLNVAAPTVTSGRVGLGSTTSATATAGGTQTVPATVLGYLIANVAGTTVKIPYFSN